MSLDVKKRYGNRNIKKYLKRILISFLYIYFFFGALLSFSLINASLIFINNDIDDIVYLIKFKTLGIVSLIICIDIILLTVWAFATLLAGKEEI
jgi:hypothetical protein